MSNNVDKRVVQMIFDNEKFESKVRTTMNTLNNLKKSLNLDKASSEFDKLEKAASTVSFSGMEASLDQISSRFTTFGIVGVTAIQNITTYAMRAGKNLLSSLTSPLIEGGKRRALNIEQAKFQIQGLGYAWEDVEADINYGVKDTAYGLDAAAKAASQLLASQVKVGDEMKSALRGISGVAAMTNSEYEDIANIFTTVAGNGKLMGDQLMQMSSRGLNAAATLGQYLGKTEGEVREMVSKGKIDFATFSAAMDSAFGEHAKKANETFNGSLSNMKAALSRIGAAFATPGYTNLRDFFNALTPQIDNVKKALTPLINSAEEGMKALSTFAVSVLGSLNLQETLAGPLSQVDLIFRALAKTVVNFAQAVAKILGPILSAFSDTLGGTILDILVRFSQALENFSSQMIMSDRMSENLRKTFQGIFTVLSVVLDLLSRIIGIIAVPLLTAATRVFGFIADVLLTITGFAGDIIVAVKKFVDEILELKVVQALFGAITTVMNTLKSAIDFVATGVHNLVIAFLDRTFEAVSFIFTNISGAVLIVAQAIDELIVKFASFIAQVRELPIVVQTIENISNAFNYLRDNTGEIASFVGNRLVSAFYVAKSAIISFIGVVKELIDKYVQLPTAQEAVARIQQFITDLFTNGKQIFEDTKELISAIVDKVKDVTEVSLKKAIDNFNLLKNKIIEVVDAANRMEAIKSFLIGLRDGFFVFSSTTGDVLNQVKDKFVNFVNWLGDKFANLTMGDIMAAGVGASIIPFFISLTKLVLTLDKLAGGIGNLAKIGENIGKSIAGVFKSISSVAEAKATAIKMEAITGMIKSVVLLAGAIAVLATMDPERVKNSAIVLGGLAAALVIMSTVMGTVSKNVNPELVAKNSAMLISIGGAMLALAAALKIIATINMDGIAGRLVVMGVLMAELAAFTIAVSKLAPEMSKGSFSIISLSLSLILLSKAMSRIGEIEPRALVSSMAALGVMMTFLALVSKIAGNKANAASALGIVTIAVSLNIMISALKNLAGLDATTVTAGMTRLIEMMGAVALLMIASRLAGKYAGKAGVSILLISVAMNVLTLAIKKMGELDQSSLSRAGNVISEILKVFALITLMTGFAGKNAAKAGVAIGMMSASLLVIAGAMALMAKIDPDGLKRATDAVTQIMGMFAIIVAATGVVKDAQKTLLIISVTVLSLAAALAILSLIDPANLMPAATAMSMLMASFALIVASTGLIKTSKSTILLMAAVVLELALVIRYLSDIPIESTVGIAESLSVLLVSLSAALAILQFVKPGPAMQGCMALVGIIGVIGLVMGALGALVTQIPEVQQFLEAGIPVLKAIGEGIGGFIGSLVGGAIGSGMGAASSGIVTLGENLSRFMDNIQPFLEGCSDIDSSIVDGAKNLALAVMALCAADIMDSISLLFGSHMDKLGEKLVEFAKAMKNFTNELGDVDIAKLINGSIAARYLAELINALPKEGGAIQWFTGSVDFEKLSSNLPKFGFALSAFAGSVANLNSEAINNAIQPALGLVEISNALNKEGSLAGILIGSNSDALDKLSDNLPAFGRALMNFSQTVTLVNADAINNAVGPAKAVVEISNALNPEGGVAGFLFGENSEALSSLSANLPAFATALVSFGETVSSLNADAINNAVAPTQALVEIFKALNPEGGLAQLITGSTDIASKAFTDNLSTLGTNLVGFSDDVSSLKTDPVNNALEVTRSILEIFKSLDQAGSILEQFAGESGGEGTAGAAKGFNGAIWGLGLGLKQFSSAVDGIKINGCRAATAIASDLALVFNTIQGSGGLMSFIHGDKAASFSSLGDNAGKLGKGLAEFATEVSEVTYSENVGYAVQLAKDLVETYNLIDEAGGLFETNKVDAFKDGAGKLAEALKDYSDKVSDGINISAINTSISAFESISEFSTNNGDASGTIAQAGDVISGFGEKMKSFADNIASIDTTKLGSVGPVLEALKTAVTMFQDFDITPLSEMTSALKDVSDVSIQGLIEAFKTGETTLTEAAKSMANSAISTVVNTFNAGQERFRTAGSFVLVHLAAGMASATQFDDRMVEIMSGMVSTANTQASKFHQTGQIIATWMAGGVNQSSGLITTAFSSIMTTVVSAANNEVYKFNEVGKNLVTFMGNAVRSNGYVVSSAVRSVVDSASGLTDVYDKFYNLGKNFAKGMANGINYNSYLAVAAARSMANMAALAAANAIVVASPSKRMYKIGKYFSEGFNNGIVDYGKNAVKSAAQVANDASNVVKDSMEKVYKSIVNLDDYNPVITPILDASLIDSGLSDINSRFANNPTFNVGATLNGLSSAMSYQRDPLTNRDVVSAINKLSNNLDKLQNGSTTIINGVTYDDGSGISTAVGQLVEAVIVDGRM